MNASSLYVTVLRLVFQNDATNVYRLFPYLRQSLSCSVCGNLLQEPFSPLNSPCQHHECKACIGGRKILKPLCTWCRDRQDTVQNVQLRLLLQCYKSLCEYIKLTPIYDGMQNQVQINTSNNQAASGQGNSSGGAGGDTGASNRLADIIDEGIRFKDEFKSTGGLSKATYSMLPCLYQPLAVPTQQPQIVTAAQAPQPPPTTTTTQHLIVQQQQQQSNAVPLVLPSTTSTTYSHHHTSNLLTSSSSAHASHVLLKSQPGQRTMIHTTATGQQIHGMTTSSHNNHSSGLKQLHIPSSLATVTTIGGQSQINQNHHLHSNGIGGGGAGAAGPTTVYVTKSQVVPPMPIIKTVSNGSALYSVMYAGSGNKITIKRKTDSVSSSSSTSSSSLSSALAAAAAASQQNSAMGDPSERAAASSSSAGGGVNQNSSASSSSSSISQNLLFANAGVQQQQQTNHNNNFTATGQDSNGLGFKKPPVVSSVRSKTLAKRKGCRCGNATLTPGKLTCCGQRCPCYVESKACIDCKCRGCRNPHRPDGFKVRPHIPELENLDFHLNAAEQQQQQQMQVPVMKVVWNTQSQGGGAAAASTSNGMEVDTETGFLLSGNGIASSSNGGLGSSSSSNSSEIIDNRRVNTATSSSSGQDLFLSTSRSAAGNGPGKIQVLYTTSTPSSIGSTGGLQTIIVASTSSRGTMSSTSNSSGPLSHLQQQQLALGSSSTTTTYNLMNIPTSSSSFLATTGTGGGGGGLLSASSSSSASAGAGSSATYSLTGAHSVSFQSLFGDVLPSVVTEAPDTMTEEELAEGVIIGSFASDEEEEEGDDELQELNGETVELDSSLDGEGESGDD